jgi:hypothetical protein
MSINRRADKRTEELEAEIEAMTKGTPTTVVTPTDDPLDIVPQDPIEENLSSEESSWKKRFGDLRRHNQKILDENKELKTKLQTTPSVLPDTKEKMKEWAGKNPQIAAIIRAIALEETGNTGVLDEVSKLKEELERDKAEAKVRRVHKDFDAITADSKFHDWAETQPEFVQNRIYDSLNADETIWAISLYKEKAGIKSVEMERGAAESVGRTSRTPPTPERGKGRFTESMVSRMTPAEYEKNEAAIQDEIARKVFVYDLTAGAR